MSLENQWNRSWPKSLYFFAPVVNFEREEVLEGFLKHTITAASSSGASFFAWQRRARNEWLVMNRKGPWEGYSVLPAFLCAPIFRETSGYEAAIIRSDVCFLTYNWIHEKDSTVKHRFMRTPAWYEHLIITDSLLCLGERKPLHFL